MNCSYTTQLERRRKFYSLQTFNNIPNKEIYELRKRDHEETTNPERLKFVGDRVKLMTELLMSDTNMVRFREFQLNRFAKKQLAKEKNVVEMADMNMLNLSDPEDPDILMR